MSGEDMDNVLRRLDALTERVEKLEPGPKSKSWFAVEGWQDVIKLIGVPAALVAGIYTFYDGVYLRLLNRDAATIGAVQAKISELQSLRAEIYRLQARGDDAEIQALLEAKASQHDRLTEETFAYWEDQPGYFTWLETQMLAEELVKLDRGDRALAVANALDEGATTPIRRADLERFKGSILGTRGPVYDPAAARAKFKSALALTEDLPMPLQTDQMWAKITYSWLFMEMWNRTGCEKSAPVADVLGDLIADDPDAVVLGTLDGSARTLLATHAERCPS